MTNFPDKDIDIHTIIDQYAEDRIYAERLLLKPIMDWARLHKELPRPVALALQRFDDEIGDKETYWKRKTANRVWLWKPSPSHTPPQED